ncbi:MAG TPA: hypothetical protein P5167_00920 [Bacteroidales bacterium]|nr:hypothetical protein [Bacteroidales bacterium]HRW94385.1 hypothetical protein [Bacteroidales bacterium]
MKIKIAVALIATMILFPSGIVAQTRQRGVVEAAIGSDLNTVLPDDVVYMYPEFQKGTILFSDRSTSEGMINLYLIGSHLHFISPEGDTLVMKDQDAARILSIGKDTYLRHDKSWIRLLSVMGSKAIGIRSSVNIEQTQKIGAYGMADATSSISDISAMYDVPGSSAQTVYLKSLRDIPYTLTHQALLYDGNKLYIASRRSFNKLFPDKKDLVKNYIKENKLDLNQAQDVLQLFNFLNL